MFMNKEDYIEYVNERISTNYDYFYNAESNFEKRDYRARIRALEFCRDNTKQKIQEKLSLSEVSYEKLSYEDSFSAEERCQELIQEIGIYKSMLNYISFE